MGAGCSSNTNAVGSLDVTVADNSASMPAAGSLGHQPGRTNHATRANGIDAFNALPERIAVSSSSSADATGSDGAGFSTIRPTSVPSLEPCQITEVDLKVLVNSFRHHTDKYEITNEPTDTNTTPAQLVVRRGQEFKLSLSTNRVWNDEDKLRIIADIGDVPLRSKGTHITISPKEPQDGWSCELLSSDDDSVDLAILPPATCAVGKWKFSFATSREEGDEEVIAKQTTKCEIYILFNAWCKDDTVYLEDESLRDEYVMNDSGKIYTGNYKQIFGKPWNFAQFESIVLECILWLLDNRGELAWHARGDSRLVSRKISALVNSSDDWGILTGRWVGEYTDGTSPTKWTGSEAILQQYMKNKRPVKYGQCWVFSGITTSVCRALGIPARSITNFASAHDTDGSLTIDNYWDEDLSPLPELKDDSIWNFHVWNEAWMTREDLKVGYGGWQVIDATPQETSDGVYCAGPASVRAIKVGDVQTNYDSGFVFAEVNADRVHWVKQKDGSQRTILEKSVIGKNISTKKPGTSLNFSRRNYDQDREDVTHEYKYDEGSSEERAAVWRAARTGTKPTVYSEKTTNDVEFKIKDIDDIFVGSDFDIEIFVKNTSSEVRTVEMTTTILSVYYTGVMRSRVKKSKWHDKLTAGEEKSVILNVKSNDYLNDMVDHNYALKIDYVAIVHETKQLHVTSDDFRLRTLIPEVTPSKNVVKIGDKFSVMTKFTNPLDKPLTACVFSFESAGNLKQIDMKIGDVPVGGVAKCECPITSKRSGDCIVICSFECKEMGDVQGQCSLVIQS